MSRLTTNKAPSSVIVDGVSYALDTSYLSALEAFEALKDGELSEMKKAGEMIDCVFIGDENYTPEIWQALVEKAVWYLRGGEHDEQPEKKPTVDFDFDGDRIVDAFNAKGINLDEIEDMHWWTFMSHFRTLPECGLTRIMYLRQLHNSRELYKKEHKSEYKEAQKIGMHIIEMKTLHEILDDYEDGIMDALF